MNSFSEGNMIWVVFGVITVIVGLLLSFIAPNLIHLVLFSSGDLIYIHTPTISNILFSVGALCLALFCFSMYFPRKKARIAAISFIVLFVAASALSLGNYSVLRDERIVHNSFFSLNSKEYSWSDVQNAVLLKRNDDTPYETLVLTMSDGEKLSYDRDASLRAEFDQVDYILQSNGIYFNLQNR